MVNRMKKNLFFLFTAFLFIFFYYSLSSASITAQPGNFDHFQLETPENLIVGKEYNIFLYAVDSFGNKLTISQDSQKKYKIKITGMATIQPQAFNATEINQTGFALKIRNEKAEEVSISLFEDNKPLPILEKKVKFFPESINSFNIKTPSSSRVGSNFDIIIYGIDKFGNTVCENFEPRELNLFFKGDISPQVRDFQYFPSDCNIKVTLYSEKTGVFHIETSLLGDKIRGKSDKIEILNGELASFIVESPSEAFLDEPFELNILAVDKFKNPVKDFSTQRHKILIESKGKGTLFPSEILSHTFSEGRTTVSVRYNKPEEIKIVIKLLSDSSKIGESGPVKILPPEIKRFEVTSPQTVIAGQRFKIRITAYNNLDKVMTNYNIYGKPVILKSTGSGNLSPNLIPPSAFIQGVAVVDVIYDKAEKFDIIATVATEEEKVLPDKVEKKKRKEREIRKKAHVAEKKEITEQKPKRPITQKLELKNISLVETKKDSKVILSVPNIGKIGAYHPKTIKKDKKMSVLLEITPAFTKLESPTNFDSEFIKEIYVSEEKNKVILNIFLKRPFNYRTFKKQDEIIIEFRRN